MKLRDARLCARRLEPHETGEVVHNDLERPSHADVTGIECFQVFVDETSRDKLLVGLTIRDALTNAPAAHLSEMTHEAEDAKSISGNGAG